MPGNRARLEELRAKKQAAMGPQGSSIPGVDFAKSMLRGSSIAEHMPGGEMIGDLGSKIGSGIVAATSAPFSDQSMGQIYDQSMAAAAAEKQRQAELDALSPAAQGVKSGLAGLAMMGQRAPVAAAELPAAAFETAAAEMPFITRVTAPAPKPLVTQAMAPKPGMSPAAAAAEEAALTQPAMRDPFSKIQKRGPAEEVPIREKVSDNIRKKMKKEESKDPFSKIKSRKDMEKDRERYRKD